MDSPKPNLDLPPPVESMPAPPADSGLEAREATPSVETAPAAEKQPALTAPLPALPLSPILPIQQGSVASDDVPTTTVVTPPALADDDDLIEKEWVMKAKEIVAKTKDDPYRQSKEMTGFKADYMKKRYNKVIKVTE